MARICVVTQAPAIAGGILTKLAFFLGFAASRGHVCDLYFPDGSTSGEAEIASLRGIGSIDRIFPTRVTDQVPHFMRNSLFARRCKFEGDYDAAILVAGSLGLGMPLARHPMPYVAWLAGTHRADVEATPRTRPHHFLLYNPVSNALTERQERVAARTARRLLPVSRESGRQLRSALDLPEEWIQVLPVGVDVERLRPKGPDRSARPYVLSVARLDRRKDFPTLFRAFQRVAAEIPEIELRVVGEGKERPELERLLRELGLQERVRLLGSVPGDALVREYQGATLFALSSRQEGLGIVFLEALACGVPIVATDCGGSADPIENGKTGFLAPVGDWRTLGAEMLRLLSDKPLLEGMRTACRERAVESYSYDAIDARLEAVFSDVFGVHGEARHPHPRWP